MRYLNTIQRYCSSSKPLFHDIRHDLPTIVQTQRHRMKDIRTQYGKLNLGSASLTNLLEGGNTIPAIYSQFHASSNLLQDFQMIQQQFQSTLQ